MCFVFILYIYDFAFGVLFGVLFGRDDIPLPVVGATTSFRLFPCPRVWLVGVFFFASAAHNCTAADQSPTKIIAVHSAFQCVGPVGIRYFPTNNNG